MSDWERGDSCSVLNCVLKGSESDLMAKHGSRLFPYALIVFWTHGKTDVVPDTRLVNRLVRLFGQAWLAGAQHLPPVTRRSWPGI